MRTTQRGAGPVALSSFDLPLAQHLLVHSCEDCACPVTESRGISDPRLAPGNLTADTQRWICGPEIVDIPLDEEHRVLFNPVGAGGVVVVNEPARRMFRSFEQPSTFAHARVAWPDHRAEFAALSERLVQLEMLQRPEHPPLPRFQRAAVLTAWLHVTNACNLRCPYCYIHKSSERMDESVGFAAVEAIVRSAAAHGYRGVKLKYAGGEASLNHGLMLGLHAHARALTAQHGLALDATLLSNGVALRPTLIEALRSEGIRVMISLDGVGARHDAQRPFVRGHGHPPHISITITSRNAAGLADVVRFALDRDLTFSLNFFRDNDCAESFSDLQYEEQAMVAALLDAFGVIEEHLPRWSVLGSILDRGQLLQPRQHSCAVGQDYVVVDQRGGIAKCHMEIERTLGDVFSDDPLQLVRRDLTTVQNLPVEEKEGCRDCPWRYWCSGGCAVATFKATGRYDIKSPNCNIYKAIYPQALRLEGLRLLKHAIPAATNAGGS